MLIRKIECEESNHRGHRESHDRMIVVVNECSVNGILGSNTDSTRFRVLAPLAMYDPKGATRDVKRDH